VASSDHSGGANQSQPKLPSSWRLVKLRDVSLINMGQSPPSSSYNTEGKGLPFFQGKAEFGKLYPSPVKWCTLPKKTADSEDILISVRAPVGPTNLSPSHCCIGRGLAAVKPRAEMPPRYFLYYLRTIEDSWDQVATGTTFKAIGKKQLEDLDLPLAPSPSNIASLPRSRSSSRIWTPRWRR